MKKIFTLIAAAIVSLTAFAQQEVALSPKTMVEDATIASEMPMRAAVKRLAKPEQSTNARAAKKAMTAADIVGTYVTYNDLYSSSYEYDYSTAAKIVAGEEANTVLITGLYGQSDEYPLKGTVENGQLIIPCNQQINTNATYGMVTLGVIAVDETGTALKLYKDEAHPITFDIYADGLELVQSQYGLVMFVPEYSTGNYNLTPYIYFPVLFVPNGTMTSEIAKSASDLSVGETRTNPVYIQTNGSQALVYGFDRTLVCPVAFRTDGTCHIPASTPLYYYSNNKSYAYAYKATKSSSSGNFAYYNNTDPEGTYAANAIEIGMWGLYSKSATGMTILNGRKLNSKIVLNEGELNVADYSALDGTYKVDAKIVVEGARQGEDLLEGQEIKVKQSINAGYIDVTLPACTSQGFSMAETVVKGIKVTAAKTPGVYALSGENFPIVIGGKTITASISNFGILNTNDNTINMTVNATLPEGLGTMTVTYSMNKPKPQTAVISWEESMTSANEVTCANGFKVAISGNTSKNLSAGNGSIAVDGVTYRTLKNSNGAQNSIYAPEGKVINSVTFYVTANYDTNGNPILSEFEGASTSYEVTSLKDYENPTVLPCTLATPASSVTFTFSKCQVCYVAVVEYSTSTAISTVKAESAPKAKKYIQNGQLIIEKNGQKFNAAGMKM